jgi:hypothetical protein
VIEGEKRDRTKLPRLSERTVVLILAMRVLRGVVIVRSETMVDKI